MIDDRELLERAAAKVSPPQDVFIGIERLRARKGRRRRTASGFVSLGIVAAAIAWGIQLSHPPAPSAEGIGLPGVMAYGSGVDTFVLTDSGGSAQFLTHGSPLAWSPDGSRLLIVRDVVGGKHSPVMGGSLFVLNADGSEERLTPPGVRAGEGSWSPDGSRIVYRLGASIAEMNADGSGTEILVPEGPNTRYYSPAWSPDGSRIAYISAPKLGGGYFGSLYVMAADGSGQTQLLGGDRYLVMYSKWPTQELSWSPDGSRIAFVNFSAPLGNGPYVQQAIETLDLPTSEVTWLFRAGTHECSNPSWTPDGDQVAFLAADPKRFADAMFLVGPDGSDLHRANNGPTLMPSTIAWRPQGQPT